MEDTSKGLGISEETISCFFNRRIYSNVRALLNRCMKPVVGAIHELPLPQALVIEKDSHHTCIHRTYNISMLITFTSEYFDCSGFRPAKRCRQITQRLNGNNKKNDYLVICIAVVRKCFKIKERLNNMIFNERQYITTKARINEFEKAVAKLEKLTYIGQQTHRNPNTLLSQSIDLQYQQLKTQNAKNRVEQLFWSQDAYGYISRQSDLFDAMLPELIAQYAGMYILFDDGNVIDADVDEDILLVGGSGAFALAIASPWRIECGKQISFGIESLSITVSSAT